MVDDNHADVVEVESRHQDVLVPSLPDVNEETSETVTVRVEVPDVEDSAVVVSLQELSEPETQPKADQEPEPEPEPVQELLCYIGI